MKRKRKRGEEKEYDITGRDTISKQQ